MNIDTSSATARRIACLRLPVADLGVACAFYSEALGFCVAAMGADGADLRLGAQAIELTLADPPGAAYPRPRAANDPWFQHFAIAVSDMAAAYERLSRHAFEPITRGGPQLLPPSTGSVTAFKFRDPDGHPLELSQIPGGAWAREPGPGPFLGVDHTALAVRDLEASVAFYTEVMGFSPGGRFLNRGPEQDRLDGLDGVELDIAVLTTGLAGPHIELLHYRVPASPAAPESPQPPDIAAIRTVVEVADVGETTSRLDRRGLAWRRQGGGVLARDPDGHFLKIIAP